MQKYSDILMADTTTVDKVCSSDVREMEDEKISIATMHTATLWMQYLDKTRHPAHISESKRETGN